MGLSEIRNAFYKYNRKVSSLPCSLIDIVYPLQAPGSRFYVRVLAAAICESDGRRGPLTVGRRAAGPWRWRRPHHADHGTTLQRRLRHGGFLAHALAAAQKGLPVILSIQN